MTRSPKASYEFKVDSREPGLGEEPTIVVLGDSLGDAIVGAYELLHLDASKARLILIRAVDTALLVIKQEVVERKLLVEERNISTKVELSGEITENRRELK